MRHDRLKQNCVITAISLLLGRPPVIPFSSGFGTLDWNYKPICVLGPWATSMIGQPLLEKVWHNISPPVKTIDLLVAFPVWWPYNSFTVCCFCVSFVACVLPPVILTFMRKSNFCVSSRAFAG